MSAASRKAPTMQSKALVLEELRRMLKDVFAATATGHVYSRVARAHGYVDGFMRALLDTGFATKAELLALVAQEREQMAWPATRSTLDLDDPIFSEASSREAAA
jgi:hypothetical protein